MAMVQQRSENDVSSENENETENENENEAESEKESHVSENSDEDNKPSRPSSRNSCDSKRQTPAFLPQYQYSKDELMDMSKLPLSVERPACLDTAHNNSAGKWDPGNWFQGKRGDKATVSESEDNRLKRVRTEVDAPLTQKRRTSDPRERIKEEKDDIILSPQRRSFGTGCHVIQHSTFPKRPGSPTDLRDNDSFRDRRIGSGRITTREREQRDWERDHRDFSFTSGRNERRDRFDSDDGDKENKRYQNRYGRDRRMRGHERIDEEEPEWFSSGPTSQSETIELVGFDDPLNDGESRKTNRKMLKKNKEQNRRQIQKSEEQGRTESSEVPSQIIEKENIADEIELKHSRASPAQVVSNGEECKQKQTNSSFDIDDLLRFDWIPGLLTNESPHNESSTNEIGVSRFSQWFSRESPLPRENHRSGENSRRSSYHEELHTHAFNEAAILSQSPLLNCTENYFTPISPVLCPSPECIIAPPHPANEDTSKNLLAMLKINAVNGPQNEDCGNGSKNIQEMEADLKRLVLGNNQRQTQDISAFDKLLQHMPEATSSSMSIGPLDKSKVLQEEDLLQNLLGHRPSTAMKPPTPQTEASASNSGSIMNRLQQWAQQSSSPDLYNKLLEHRHQQLEMQQQVKNLQQMQKQHHLQNQMQKLAERLEAQSHGPLSPMPPGIPHPSTQMSFQRNEPPPTMNAMLHQQRQRDIMNLLKQHMSQRPQNSQMIHPIKCPASKEVGATPTAQTLGIPGMPSGTSPRQSPMPLDVAIHTQKRIPSPLVFGQQPPALSHAPAPIHPNHLAQGIPASNSNASNTLQVQNSIALPRVPSPQELAVHTQSILQGALIKRKLEEQKENFRKRQEAQRGHSPVMQKSGNGSSPMKGVSPTIAFTPTAVMRKMHSEKIENLAGKLDVVQNGANKVCIENKPGDHMHNALKQGNTQIMENFFAANRPDISHTNNRNGAVTVPRPVYGQCSITSSRPQHAVAISSALHSNPLQGRPIVKGVNNQMAAPGSEVRPPQNLNKSSVTNKLFPTTNNQFADRESSVDAVSKFLEQQRIYQQQQQQQKVMAGQRRHNTSPMPSVHVSATSFGFPPRGGVNPPSGNMTRPMNVNSMNLPLLRTMMQANPVVRGPTSLNSMQGLNQLAALQQMQRTTDNRQILAHARNIHPMVLQQLLLNSQNQAQGVGGISSGDGKNHLMPTPSGASRQSPVNLTKWFGNDVLKQEMPEMPPVPHQKALRLEDIERQQQQHQPNVRNVS